MLRKTIDSREKGPRCGNINLNVAAHRLNGNILYTSVNNLVDWRGCPGRLQVAKVKVDENNVDREKDYANGKDDAMTGLMMMKGMRKVADKLMEKMMKTVIKKPFQLDRMFFHPASLQTVNAYMSQRGSTITPSISAAFMSPALRMLALINRPPILSLGGYHKIFTLFPSMGEI